MQWALTRAVARLRAAGTPVDDLDPPDGWDRLVKSARIINQYEGARTQQDRFVQFGDRIGRRLADLVRSGLTIPQAEYESARAHVQSMRVKVEALFREYPAILTPATEGPAPVGLDFTGDPVHNAPWTALGTPSIAIPLPVDGAPLGMQIAAPRGGDDALAGMAEFIERELWGGQDWPPHIVLH
jgi:Asp-tRNA(Asn)/Glu-tRNA(Gln) amidotransferase A subunit family amidase